MARLRVTANRDNDPAKIHAEHTAIIDALDRGDPQGAESAVRSHIRGVPWARVLGQRSGIRAAATGDAA